MELSKVDQFLRDHMHIVRRLNPPTKFSYEPYSTQWHATGDGGPVTCYVQTSKDEDKPNWVRLGELLERAMFDKTEDAAFMEECIQIYLREEK